MGGKHKQAQRTKNNARPSSSGRSAELLANAFDHAVLATMKEAGFSIPNFSLANVDDIDPSIDTNLQLVLKKMNKKDATTKLKALQEFADLIKASDQEAVKTVLVFWTRLYGILATDAEHKIREATHVAHQQVVTKAKRNMAPYLKQLAGPWFTSQYDTYAPAASAATKSFEVAFPQNKIQEAIVFCQEEILTYVCDNLTVHSAQSLNNPKTSSEDTEAKYERIVISSLQGYTLYLNKVNAEAVKLAEELNVKIVSNAKFWKLSKSKVAPVRAAWFGALTALVQKAPFLLTKELANVSSAVFGNLDESEPTVLPNVWEAALLTVTTLDTWWEHISVEKVLLPKLFKVLREGGQGNAAVIFPNLLPLLSHFLPVVDVNTFYFSYFDNMRLGLKQKNVITSRLESSAISTSIIECLQYTILKNQANVPFCEKLIKIELVPIIEWCLSHGEIAYKSLFNQIASLVQYWHRNRHHPDVCNYAKYLRYFWANVNSLFQGLLMNMEQNYETNAISDLAERQIEFMMSLKHIVKPKKQLKVKFTTDAPASFGDVGTPKSAADKIDETYLTDLNCLVYDTCESYIKFVDGRQSKELIGHLFSLLEAFNSEGFFKTLNAKLGGQDLMHIYDNLLLRWLQSKDLCARAVIDLVYMLFPYLQDDDKTVILDTLTKLNNEQFGWCIARALSHPHNSDPVVQNWLSNEKVDEFLISIVEKELGDESTPDLNLVLKQAFTESNDGDLYISKRAVAQIIHRLSKCLLRPSDFLITVDTCASLASYVSSILYTDSLGLSYGDELLLSLFTLSCNSRLNDEISKDTLWEVSTAWQDAVGVLSSSIPLEDFKRLTGTMARVLEKEFLDNDVETTTLDEMVNKIVSYVRVIQKNCPMIGFNFLAVFFDRPFVSTLRKNLTDVCVHAEYLRGNLTSYAPINDDLAETKDEDILRHVVWTQLIVGVLLTPIDAYDPEEEDLFRPPSAIVKLADDVDTLVLNLIYNVVLAESFVDNYKMTKYYKNVCCELQMLTNKTRVLVESLDADVKRAIETKLSEISAAECWLWVKTVRFVYSKVMPKLLVEVYDDYVELEQFCGEKNLGLLHLTQVFSEVLWFDVVRRNRDTKESVVTLRSLLHNSDIEVQIAETFNKIEKMKIDAGDKFYEMNFSDWETTQLMIDIIKLSTDLIAKDKIAGLSSRHWDFMVVSLATCCLKIADIKHNYQRVQVAAYISAITELFAAVESYVKKLQVDSPRNKYVCEWNDLFSQDVHADILKLWLYLAETFLNESTTGRVPLKILPFLQSFERAITNVNYVYVFEKISENTPKWSRLLKTSCNLLISNVGVLQLWGYHMLNALSPGLIQIDAVAVDTNTPHEKGLIFEQFKPMLKQTQEIVQAMLQDFKLGEDSCRVEPFTDSYTYTFAYLLIWDILLDLCEKSSTELRYQYADWLRNEDFLSNVLTNIFKLMPIEVLHYTDGRYKPFNEWFLKKFSLLLTDPVDSSKIEHVVCWVYVKTVSQLPASVRQWWSDTETRIAQVVDKVTSAYVSPQLCNQELIEVGQHETKFKNMVIKVHPSVREVVAIYTVDDAQMDLVITLPTNYPLGGPAVQCNRQIGGTSHKQWLMQLKMCVLHQNGSIWDGLALWNNNLNKKFDGVEECYICFSVLHPGTYQLPKLSCQTCRKKFHSACLYKWFSTSNKSTCPICRNLF